MTREEAIYVLRTESVEIGGNAVSVARFLTALDVVVKAIRQQETVTNRNGLNNANRIRSMSDEELAVFLDSIWEISYIAHQKGTGNTLKWLQQPAEEDKHEAN